MSGSPAAPELARLLADHPLTGPLDDWVRARVAQVAELIELGSGEVLVR